MSENGNDLGKLAEALAKAQAAFPKVLKDRTAKIRSPKGDYEYKYADLGSILEATRKPLTDNGLALSQPIEVTPEGHIVLHTMLLHISGAHLDSFYPLAAHERPQEMGSEITYSRRYTAGSILGIASEEDDDGAAAQHAPRVSDIGRPDRVTTPTTDAEVMQAFPEGIERDDHPDPRPGFAAGDKTCPYCKKAAVIKGKAEYGGGWLCFQKRGGCGQKWPELAVTTGGKSVDAATGEVKADDDRPFLIGAVIKGLRGLTGEERGELFTIHLDGRDPTGATTGQLNNLYLFLGDAVKVKAWQQSRVAR